MFVRYTAGTVVWRIVQNQNRFVIGWKKSRWYGAEKAWLLESAWPTSLLVVCARPRGSVKLWMDILTLAWQWSQWKQSLQGRIQTREDNNSIFHKLFTGLPSKSGFHLSWHICSWGHIKDRYLPWRHELPTHGADSCTMMDTLQCFRNKLCV